MKVLKFGAVWCPGCLVMKPRWEKIEEENVWLKTEYHDFDNDKEMVKKYNVDKILPVFVFLDSQENEFMRLSGEIEKDELIELLCKNKDK